MMRYDEYRMLMKRLIEILDAERQVILDGRFDELFSISREKSEVIDKLEGVKDILNNLLPEERDDLVRLATEVKLKTRRLYILTHKALEFVNDYLRVLASFAGIPYSPDASNFTDFSNKLSLRG